MAKRIEAVGVTAYYGQFKAIEDITMTIEPRSVTALIGPSGCGKSTFLRTVNGQDIYERGVDVTAVRRSIGMVFQRPNPFPTMSIYDNVVAGLKLNGVRKKSLLDDACEKALKSANLWDEVRNRLGKPGAGLSGGQQQRLCIARTIAVEPQVVLMDEPCSALDPISTGAIEDLIFELKNEFTIIIVTHNMQQAARVSDRTAFFSISQTGDPGRLIEYDVTSKIFTNPREKRTEDYITGRFG
jgi:phosphate transport system ATP-binding protein